MEEGTVRMWDARFVIPDIDPVKFLKMLYAFTESLGGEVVANEVTEEELDKEEQEITDGETIEPTEKRA